VSCVICPGKSYGGRCFAELGIKFCAFTHLAKDGVFVGNEGSVSVVHELEYHWDFLGFVVSSNYTLKFGLNRALTLVSFIPETRNRTLEELDRTFGSPARDLIRFGFEQIEYFVQRKILRQGMGDPPVLPCDKARRRQHEIDTEHEDKPFERESYVSKPEVIPKP